MHSSVQHIQALLIELLQQQPAAIRSLLENVGLSSAAPKAAGQLSQERVGVLSQDSHWIVYDFVAFPDPHAPQRWAAACLASLKNHGSDGTLLLFVKTQRMETWVTTQAIQAGCTQFRPTVANLGPHATRLLARRDTTLRLLGLWAQEPDDALLQAIQLINVASRRSLDQGLQMADTLFVLGSESLKTNLFQTLMTMYKQPRTTRFPYRSPYLRNMLHLLQHQSSQSAQAALARKWILHVVHDRRIRLSRSLRLAIEHSEDLEALEALFLSLLPHQQKAELYNALRRFRWGRH